jgi:hypothetical protein
MTSKQQARLASNEIFLFYNVKTETACSAETQNTLNPNAVVVSTFHRSFVQTAVTEFQQQEKCFMLLSW